MNFGLNPFTVSSGLSFTRILGSISKTLGIVRGIAPIYKDIKPLIQKAPKLLERLTQVRNNISTLREPSSNNYMTSSIDNVENTPNYGPTFFK